MTKYCPRCAAKTISQLYPKKGGEGHTVTLMCHNCHFTWHMREAMDRSDDDLKDKFTVLKDNGMPVSAPTFVLVLTDPAARAAAMAYAVASMNVSLCQELKRLLNSIETRPTDYQEPGSEGRLNACVSYRAFEHADMSVIVVMKNEDDF